jgi:hypothetical protein
VTHEHHELAKRAKDAGAALVFPFVSHVGVDLGFDTWQRFWNGTFLKTEKEYFSSLVNGL